MDQSHLKIYTLIVLIEKSWIYLRYSW